ncbi:MAG: toprim domain-containing protein, partial [Candidatus Pacebacteria bacterium]|nr:toprim domain-containing protein [Candidatus Paceibacterota bacterium]
STIYDHLLSKGVSSTTMEKAGLVARGDKGYYDRFRGRVMFPIMNSSGKVVAFSGRVFHVSGASEDKTAKYVNSPETELYDKSAILYGFDKAKQAIRKSNSCIFVEGQMDIVMSHQTGVENTVAVSGTALSERHLDLVRRIADNLIFAFDADEAGISAARRGVNLALASGFEVKIVAMPEGRDPADMIKDDPDVWKKDIKEAQHVIDFYIEYCLNKDKDSRMLRKNIEEYVLPYIVRLQSDMDKAQFVAKVADVLHISETPIWNELKKIQVKVESDTDDNLGKPEIDQKKGLSRKEKIEEKIIGIVLWQKGTSEAQVNTVEIQKSLEEMKAEVKITEDTLTAKEKGRLVFEAEIYCDKEKSVAEYISDLLTNYKKEILKEKAVSLRQELIGDTVSEKAQEEILKDIQNIQKEIELLDKNGIYIPSL